MIKLIINKKYKEFYMEILKPKDVLKILKYKKIIDEDKEL